MAEILTSILANKLIKTIPVKKIKSKTAFIGRSREIETLNQIHQEKKPAIVIVYGRRRVGKTTLIERAYGKRNLLKIEGVEGGNQAKQIETALLSLSYHLKDPAIAKLNFKRWLEFFEFLSRYLKSGVHTLYLEELQWLASYNEELISDFKHAWDNHFSKNPNLIAVLCGSSPSFMTSSVVHSKALYGRSQHEILVRPFNIQESSMFLGKSFPPLSAMDAYLTLGGIPEYLSYLRKSKSIYLSLCEESFLSEGYFFTENERVFISSLAKNKNYRKVIELLSKAKFLNRNEISKKLNIDSGGSLTALLSELELCGFINSYTPYDKPSSNKLARYEISDNFLQFYYRFIAPQKKRILDQSFVDNPSRALNLSDYQQWLGYSFERWCRTNHLLFAKILSFSAVQYDVGPYYSRQSPEGFQIDLIFSRKDKVLTVCEIKYKKTPITKSVIKEFEKKLNLLEVPPHYSIQKVLITASGADQAVKNNGYFDEIIDAERIFSF